MNTVCFILCIQSFFYVLFYMILTMVNENPFCVNINKFITKINHMF